LRVGREKIAGAGGDTGRSRENCRQGRTKVRVAMVG